MKRLDPLVGLGTHDEVWELFGIACARVLLPRMQGYKIAAAYTLRAAIAKRVNPLEGSWELLLREKYKRSARNMELSRMDKATRICCQAIEHLAKLPPKEMAGAMSTRLIDFARLAAIGSGGVNEGIRPNSAGRIRTTSETENRLQFRLFNSIKFKWIWNNIAGAIYQAAERGGSVTVTTDKFQESWEEALF